MNETVTPCGPETKTGRLLTEHNRDLCRTEWPNRRGAPSSRCKALLQSLPLQPRAQQRGKTNLTPLKPVETVVMITWIKKLFRRDKEEHKTRPRRLTGIFEM